MNCVVYMHRKADTGDVFYVGSGLTRRARDVRGRNDIWTSIVERHGFTVEVVAEGLERADARALEEQLIAQHQAGGAAEANIFAGTRPAAHMVGRVRGKRTAAMLERWTDEAREARSVRMTGAGNPFSGRQHSDETRARLRQARRSPIECKNLDTGETVIVSGTRAAADVTGQWRQTIMRNLQSGTATKTKPSWLFRRLDA